MDCLQVYEERLRHICPNPPQENLCRCRPATRSGSLPRGAPLAAVKRGVGGAR